MFEEIDRLLTGIEVESSSNGLVVWMPVLSVVRKTVQVLQRYKFARDQAWR